MPVSLEIAVIAAPLAAAGDKLSAKFSGFPGSKTLDDVNPECVTADLIFLHSSMNDFCQ